jgi:hypothetical protein
MGLKHLARAALAQVRYPPARAQVVQSLRHGAFLARAERFIANRSALGDVPASIDPDPAAPLSDLRALFEANLEGPGIWKWMHYFSAYEEHLGRYRGTAPVVAEIGVFSGGSLRMWREWFGAGAEVHGIDIDPECRSYESLGVSIHIGDQGDPSFWRDFRRAVPRLDVLIDDGGHLPEQQATTLEEVLPHLAPGGTLIIEDIHGLGNAFSSYMQVLVAKQHEQRCRPDGSAEPNVLQAHVEQISFLPYMAVIRKRRFPLQSLAAERRGTEWQPARVFDSRGHIVHGRGVYGRDGGASPDPVG